MEEKVFLYCPDCRREYEFTEYREPVYCGHCNNRYGRRVQVVRDLPAELERPLGF